MPITGAIFDCDGTLADSMGMWRQVVEGLLVKRGMPVPPDFYERTEPVSLHDGCVMVHEEFGLGQDAESLYEELCADVRAAYARVPLLPGARDFLQELACAGIPMVMASSTPVRELRSCLETHGIAGFFKDVVSTEDVGGRDKEFPDVYEEALRRLKEAPVRRDMVERVSCRKRWFSRTANHRFDVVAVDCGIKHNIIRKLNEKGCNVTVVPYDITAEEVMAFRPDGLFLSNGPGDPTDVQPVIEMVRTLRGRLPIFGICLGHQVISLAYGARTFKMKFGHRGGNHPVKNLETGKVEITSQNHSFAVDTESLKGTGLTLTHLNLLDDTAEGVECRADRIFSVQYHPESAPGPQDSTYLFDKFIKMMEESQNA